MPSKTAEGRARAVLWTDGAARGNPGPAAIGAVLKTPDGVLLGAFKAYIGITTNNQAEYRALLLGLQEAKALGIREIEVRADSELMIRQLRGQYRVKNAQLKPLYEQARALLSSFEATSLCHVPRAENSEADALANEALDERKAQ